MSGRFATGMSGFGRREVSAFRRVPRPAPRTNAVRISRELIYTKRIPPAAPGVTRSARDGGWRSGFILRSGGDAATGVAFCLAGYPEGVAGATRTQRYSSHDDPRSAVKLDFVLNPQHRLEATLINDETTTTTVTKTFDATTDAYLRETAPIYADDLGPWRP